MQAYLDNIKAKTGKAPDDFKILVDQQGLTKHGEIIAWLKAEFGLGHGHANLIAHLVRQGDEPAPTEDDAVAAHFSGAKAVWRKSYDDLMTRLEQFGGDVKAGPGKTYINLLRGDKKFGIVQVTAKRLDVGIRRKGEPFVGRYEDSSKWNPMVTHRVQITDPSQIDAELIDWLRQAYDNA